MHWKLTVLGATIEATDFTVAEWTELFIIINQAGVPHAEVWIRPHHCPVCRNAIATFALRHAGVDVDRVAELVGALPADELVAGIELVPEAADVAGITEPPPA